jgi:hypothetical protein
VVETLFIIYYFLSLIFLKSFVGSNWGPMFSLFSSACEVVFGQARGRFLWIVVQDVEYLRMIYAKNTLDLDSKELIYLLYQCFIKWMMTVVIYLLTTLYTFYHINFLIYGLHFLFKIDFLYPPPKSLLDDLNGWY